jgi:hypothetical protein
MPKKSRKEPLLNTAFDMNRYFRSIALIRRPADHRSTWLARWDESAKFYDFIMAEPLEHESYRECIDREVGWILNLDRARDYLVANMAQVNLESDETFPGDAQPSHIGVAFYTVDLYRKNAWQQVAATEGIRWLNSEEIHAGHTSDGHPINPSLVFLIRKSEVIQPWQ